MHAADRMEFAIFGSVLVLIASIGTTSSQRLGELLYIIVKVTTMAVFNACSSN